MSLIDKYILQALDNYPYNLEETIESLGYALSYDNKNTMALCLYGRIQAEQLYNYEEAKSYFEQALGINTMAIEVYIPYIQTLILNEDYAEADKLISFAMTIKGINKIEVLYKKILLLEVQNRFKEALEVIIELKLKTLDSNCNDPIELIEKRLKAKIDILKTNQKSKKTKKVKSKL